mmetsp:Transcript_45735/g.92316  ORF Transcript_45735/g.92316 Transcript_45735/m.92316 type:complete len:252 (-) Transcript_45735:203-958(-)
MRIISSTSSSVTVSPIFIRTCLISAAPTKLFLSKSKATNASHISSSVNLPAGSRGASPPPPRGGGAPPAGPRGCCCLGGAPGRSNLTLNVILPTFLSDMSSTSTSPSKLPVAIQSKMLTDKRPMNLSLPTSSLDSTSTNISFSVLISKLNSASHTGFLPPPTTGLVLYACWPMVTFAKGSALPNMVCPPLRSIPLTTLTVSCPNTGAAGADGAPSRAGRPGGGPLPPPFPFPFPLAPLPLPFPPFPQVLSP